jgi:hypothetical protein
LSPVLDVSDRPSTTRRVRAAVTAFLVGPGALALVWFVVAFAALVWTWGENPLAFPSPDEAVNRLAVSLLDKTGHPFIPLRFEDPEDLAHPRFWVTLGDHAVPAYAPVAIYVYALFAKIPSIGLWLIAALPASGAAAFTLAVAKLLPKRRRWLALTAPLLAWPALYWLLRPWVNISLLLVCLCWAMVCSAMWRKSPRGKSRVRWLFATFAFLGAGAAVRPDSAAYLFLAAWLFTLAESEGEWKLVLAAVVGAGVLAVGANVILNLRITGQPFRAAYQIFMSRASDASSPTLLPGILNSLLTPMGAQPPAHLWRLFAKYCLNMRPIGLLVILQASLVPVLYAMPWRKRLIYLVAILVVLCFLVSRLSDDVYGSKQLAGHVHHSIPRYLTPVYLLAALPPLLYFGRARVGVAMGFTMVLAGILATRGGYEIYVHEPDSLVYLRKLLLSNVRALRAIRQSVPSDALVYSTSQDKVLFSRWDVGTIGDPKRTAASMMRAREAKVPVYVVQPRMGSRAQQKLERALKPLGFGLIPLNRKQGVYQLESLEVATPPPPKPVERERDTEAPLPDHEALPSE